MAPLPSKPTTTEIPKVSTLKEIEWQQGHWSPPASSASLVPGYQIYVMSSKNEWYKAHEINDIKHAEQLGESNSFTILMLHYYTSICDYMNNIILVIKLYYLNVCRIFLSGMALLIQKD